MKSLIVLFFLQIGNLINDFDSINNNKKDVIYWNEMNKPNWSNYTGKAENNGMVAQTASKIEISYGIRNNVISTQVGSSFIPYESWVKKNHQSDYLLNHELLHFDITEVYARKLRKRFDLEVKTVKDYSKIDKIYSQTMAEWEKEQDLYDFQTNHSINKAQQVLWNEKVAKDLIALDAYKL